ncbi:amino acid adenylation domain-containing protein [Kitasatospora sp. NPDC048545]|uniref:amino acid adenylation domain-containing protein n=1 Tax=Kitasatospora sp. NPDC048545 TaxID=3157208 RepID=UPI0034005286
MTNPADRNPRGREDRLARLTPEQRAAFEARARGRVGAAPATAPGSTAAPALPPRDRTRPAPLSFGQERLWFVEQLAPGLGVFNEYVGLRLTGPLDVPALEAALTGLVERHEALRTVVADGEDGPVQRVLEQTAPVLRVVGPADGEADWSAERERELAEREAALPFDAEHGPMLRALLIRSAPERALLVVVNHHLVGDAWSRSVLVEELCARYRSFRDGGPVPEPLTVQYADWAQWQRAELTDTALAEPLAYWRERLDGAPHVLELATDRPRPAVPSHRGGRVHFTLDAATTEAVEQAARAARATPFMVTLAAWQAVLMRHSGQQDVLVGVPTAGRDRPELAGLVGMFVNSLVLRSDLSGDPAFGDLLDRVRETALGALAHAQVPFERLVRELRPDRDLSHAPLYQVQFGYRNVPTPDIALPGVTVELVDLDNGLCRTDLSLELARDGELTSGVCEFSRDLFDDDTVRELTDALRRVLARGAADPGLRLSELLALTPVEQTLLASAGDGGPLPEDAPDVLTAFAQAVRTRPDSEAVLPGGHPELALTYAGLDARVDELLARLRAAGVRPGDRVGLCLRRGTDLPAAMLAVLRAGAAYLPLDPDYPAARLAHVVEDARPAAVVVHAATRDAAPAGAPLLDLDTPAGADDASAGAAGAPVEAAPVDPDAPAYVIHTSGSTGRPKGVVVLRRNLTAFLAAMDRVLAERPDEAADAAGADGPADAGQATWLAVTSVSFDISVLELLWTLSRGHRVVVNPDPGTTAPVPAATAAVTRVTQAPAVPEFSLFYFASDTAGAEPGPGQYRLLLDGARFADTNGFSAVWLPERHFHAFGGPFPAPSVLAAAIAQATERIGIRAGSVVLPLHHPVRVAEEWSVVDNLSGGRVGLSFASGWHADDFVLAKDSYQDRQALTVSGIEQVRRLWRGDRLPFEGPGGRTVDVEVLPRPVQAELPYWLTSSGNPETCRTAGRLGARLLTHLLGQSVEELAEKIALYRQAWQEAGHPGRPHVTLMLHSYVGADADDVRAHARQPFRDYLRSSVGLIENLARGLGMDVRSSDFTAEDQEALLDHACARYLGHGSLIGTAEECLPLVQRLAAAGVDEIGCLVDFGVDTDVALAALPRLAELRRTAAAAPATARTAGAPAETELTALIRAHGVTHLQCTPSRARTLLDEADPQALRGLRQLLLGGEALDADLVRRLAGHLDGRIRNMYGPTETTVWSTSDEVDPTEGVVTIGRPIAGTTVRVLDPSGRRVPVGVPGELLIGGAGVTAGYLDRPELTADRFVADPESPDPAARLYRTGDLVRTLADGRIQYLSRNDHQVKIRGFRIETGEVEAALTALPGIRQCVVTAYGLGTSRAALAAYLVAEDPAAPPAPAELRAALAGQLPGFLIPSRFIPLDALPLTGNGKVDRAALPAPESVPAAGRDRTPPATPTEERIAAIWRSALQLDEVGTEEDFFELGGHSLLAARMVAGIRDELNVRLPLRSLFDSPTVAALARAVDALGAGGDAEAPAERTELLPDPARRHEPFPLTDVQRAYWIGRSGAVGGDVACHLYLEVDVADVDPVRLQDAWQAMVRRHDALRLVFGEDGTQRVLPEVPAYALAVDDLRDLPEHDRAERLTGTRARMSHQVLPADTWPLFELRASRTGGADVRLHLSIDTLIADGGSVQILLRELLAVYQGSLEPRPLELSFRDYVLAEQARREGPALQRDLDYWHGRLETLPPAPALPLARRPEELEQTRFRRREAHLPTELWDRLKSRAAAGRVTPSALALAAYSTVIGAWSAADRFTLNLTLFNRVGDHPDLAAMVGDFTALSLFEVDGATAGSFADRARRLQDRLWEDLDHQLVSGVRVGGELARRRGVAEAAMPVVFTSELGADGVGGSRVLRELGAEVAHTITQTPQVWLDHQISEDEGRLRLTWDAVEELFPEGLLDAMFEAYTGLLTALAERPDAWTDPYLGVLPAAQLDAYRALNATDGPLPEGLLHEPFLTRARTAPGRTAVVSATGTVTYGELERASAAVAHALRAAGVRPGDLVGVRADRGWEQVAAAIGVIRAGGAYLPLDAGLPAARVARSLEHAGATALLARESWNPEDAVPAGVTLLTFEQALSAPADTPPVPVPTTPSDLAYVIYTSGSTGDPKGVMIDHRGALNTVVDVNDRFRIEPSDRVLGISSLGFDLSVYDVFGTLAAGAALVLVGAGEERDPSRWSRLVAEHRVTVWNSVPALMEMLLAYADGNPAADLESLRLVMLSGDWIPVGMPDNVRALSPKAEVISLGGATEASIWSVLHPIGAVAPDRPSIPYGRPMRNQGMVVLDEAFRPRPVGVAGALFITGAGLAVGYRNAPGITARAFPTHPVTGERLYRTGDLARLLPDGDLEFLGREDSQVKVRGMRIELGEIESALVRMDGVREAAALVEGKGLGANLAAYVVREAARPQPAAPAPAAAPALDAERVRRLEARLRQPGRRADLAGREVLPFGLPSDTLDLRRSAALRGAATGFAGTPVSLADLHALLTVLARQDEDGVPRYAYGSAGGLYPVQTYLAVAPGGVAGLAAGTYYVDPAGPALVTLDGAPGAARALDPALYSEANRPLIDRAGFALFLVARGTAITPLYGELADRFCLLEAGAMAQLLRHRAADTAVALCPIGDVFPEPLRGALLLEDGQSVLHTLVGGRPPGTADDAPDSGADWTIGLRDALAERLPGYMVPQRVRLVDALPLSANGKVDRAALARLGTAPPAAPAPQAQQAPRARAAAPAPVPAARPAAQPAALGAVERLTALWREVMDGAEVDVDTNFFEAGANSIHLVRVQRRIAEDFGRELSVVEMFDRPTIRHLAELLERPAPAAAPARPTAPEPTAQPSPAPEAGAPTAGGDRGRHHERRRAARRGGSGTGPTG